MAADRVISTVDPEARHGHKTAARGFDGYKGHTSVDPDSEVIVATDVTAGNVGGGEAADVLLDEVIEHARSHAEPKQPVEVFGDASYGTADIVDRLENKGIGANVKVQAPAPPRKGLFSKSKFSINLQDQTVCCPQGIVVDIKTRNAPDRVGIASFESHCTDCPLKSACTNSKTGRTVRIHIKEATLQRSRLHQQTEQWKQKYRSTRPKVERKIAHHQNRPRPGCFKRFYLSPADHEKWQLVSAQPLLRRRRRLDCVFEGTGGSRSSSFSGGVQLPPARL